jgi:hypothetical protein
MFFGFLKKLVLIDSFFKFPLYLSGAPPLFSNLSLSHLNVTTEIAGGDRVCMSIMAVGLLLPPPFV